MGRSRLISSSCQTGNYSIHESPEQVYDFLSVNKHTQTHTHTDLFTHIHRLQDISQPRGYEFSSLFHFHSPVSSFSRLSCSLTPLLFSPLFLFQPYCFSSSLHRSFILFLIQAHCFSFCLFLSHINSLSLTPSLSLRVAVFIFQSFISTNVRQCSCPPSIDPQREEMGGEAGRKEER